MSCYREWIKDRSKEFGPIVLALDYSSYDRRELIRRSIKIVEEVAPYLCGIKINRHLILPLDLHTEVSKIIDSAHALDLPVLMDCKINDIGYTNRIIAQQYFGAGFDAVTANPFIGWENGLKPVFELVRKEKKGIVLLGYMSHEGASEGYGQKVIDPKTGSLKSQYSIFAEKAVMWNADGVVVGATHPEKISEIRGILMGEIPIYSPGIGVQGGDARITLDAGATFLIVGRSLISSENPAATARKLRRVVS